MFFQQDDALSHSGQRSMPTMFRGKWIEHVGPASWPPDVTCFGF